MDNEFDIFYLILLYKLILKNKKKKKSGARPSRTTEAPKFGLVKAEFGVGRGAPLEHRWPAVMHGRSHDHLVNKKSNDEAQVETSLSNWHESQICGGDTVSVR